MNNNKTYLSLMCAKVCFVLGTLLVTTFASASLPVINVWYGPNQTFGTIGQPQAEVNILGRVTDPDGISSLTYSLNNGTEQPLAIGPDGLRLWGDGDFNVDIAYSDLQTGANSVAITATDTLGNEATETVSVSYPGVNVWPRSYSIDWSTVSSINDVAQVTDGLWFIDQAAGVVSTDTNEVG